LTNKAEREREREGGKQEGEIKESWKYKKREPAGTSMETKPSFHLPDIGCYLSLGLIAGECDRQLNSIT
jgi:hypothetical protein